MSQPEGLSRLTFEERSSDMRWALQSADDKFERKWNFVGLAAPGAIQVSDQLATVSAYTMSPGRIGALVAVVLGLSGAVIGGLVVATAQGGLGTGHGFGGGIVAMIVGLIGITFGWLAQAR